MRMGVDQVAPSSADCEYPIWTVPRCPENTLLWKTALTSFVVGSYARIGRDAFRMVAPFGAVVERPDASWPTDAAMVMGVDHVLPPSVERISWTPQVALTVFSYPPRSVPSGRTVMMVPRAPVLVLVSGIARGVDQVT